MPLSILLPFPVFLFLLSPSVLAQTSGAEAVFRTQIVELHAKAIGILDRIEKSVPGGVPRRETQEEIFALVRLVHRVDEEAGATDLQYSRRGQPSSKVLLLVQQAAKGIDAMLTALDSYIESEDRSFLGFARDNNALVWSVRKAM